MINNQLLIGITGNIGSGKTKFCSYISDMGYKVISSDAIAQKQLNLPSSIKALTKRWGPEILVNGKPDRKHIAEIVFNNKEELEFLNNLIHPGILVALQQIVDSNQDEYLFLEIPLLFESSLQHCLDYIVLIFADTDKRLKHMSQNGISALEKLKSRMVAQIDDLNKIPLCDMVIANNGSLANLKKKAEELVKALENVQPREKIPFSL